MNKIMKKQMKLKYLLEDLNLYEQSKDKEIRLSSEQKSQIMNMVSRYNEFGKFIGREKSLPDVAKQICQLAKNAETFLNNEPGDWFDKQTIQKNAKELNRCSGEFAKIADEAHKLEQRLTAAYEDMGHILQRYFDIKEIKESIDVNGVG